MLKRRRLNVASHPGREAELRRRLGGGGAVRTSLLQRLEKDEEPRPANWKPRPTALLSLGRYAHFPVV